MGIALWSALGCQSGCPQVPQEREQKAGGKKPKGTLQCQGPHTPPPLSCPRVPQPGPSAKAIRAADAGRHLVGDACSGWNNWRKILSFGSHLLCQKLGISLLEARHTLHQPDPGKQSQGTSCDTRLLPAEAVTCLLHRLALPTPPRFLPPEKS